MEKYPLVSIITAVLDNKNYIKTAIESVLSQKYANIEYIIIDGGSKDGTLDVINGYKDKIARIISEKDKGIYDAMNKGIRHASGEIIGILNSDDFYCDNEIIKTIVSEMEKKNADACWGDLVYVEKENTNKVIRYWKSSDYTPEKFKKGWVPPHPTFFVKKKIYDKYGLFNLDFPIAADYEIMLRFLEKNKVKPCYVSKTMVKMRIGGKSNKNLLNIVKGAIECFRSWKINKLSVNPIVPLIVRPALKLVQYFWAVKCVIII